MTQPQWTVEFVPGLEEAFGVAVPDVAREFIETAALAKQEEILVLEEGFVRGRFEVSFGDYSLRDLEALGEECWIDDMYEVDWPENFADFVPFVRLIDEGAEDFDEPVRSFLVIQVSDEEAPVWLWDYDGWSVYPLAASLEDFLKGRAWEGKDPLDHHFASTPYKRFRWDRV